MVDIGITDAGADVCVSSTRCGVTPIVVGVSVTKQTVVAKAVCFVRVAVTRIRRSCTVVVRRVRVHAARSTTIRVGVAVALYAGSTCATGE